MVKYPRSPPSLAAGTLPSGAADPGRVDPDPDPTLKKKPGSGSDLTTNQPFLSIFFSSKLLKKIASYEIILHCFFSLL